LDHCLQRSVVVHTRSTSPVHTQQAALSTVRSPSGVLSGPLDHL